MPLWTIISYLIIAITILNRASVVRYMYTVSDFGERVKDKRGQVFFSPARTEPYNFRARPGSIVDDRIILRSIVIRTVPVVKSQFALPLPIIQIPFSLLVQYSS